MGNIAAVIVVVYMVLLLAISWASGIYQRKQSAESYLFAGKRLTWPLVGVMVAGIAVGGASTVGIAQNAYTHGLSAGWYNAAWACGALVMGLFFAERIRASKVQTVNQMMGAVFGDHFQLISTVIQIIVNIVIIALQIIAGGAILSALLPDIFNMEQGILLSTVIFGLISAVGGLMAASLTNVVNLLMIYFGVILGAIVLFSQGGGFEGISASLPAGISGDGSHWFHPIKGMGLVTIVAWIVTMTLQCTPSGGVVQNIFAAKTPEHARRGAIFAAIIILPAGFISSFIGIAAASLVPGLESSAMALPTVIMTLPGWMAGIILSGLWAADVSTATGLMMGVTTMFCDDILFKYFMKIEEESKRKLASRFVVISIIILAYIGATQMTNILSAIITALALFAPYAMLLTGIFWVPKTVKRSTGWLTLASGIIAFILAQFIDPAFKLGGQTIYTVVLVALVGYFISQLDKRPAQVHNLFREENIPENQSELAGQQNG